MINSIVVGVLTVAQFRFQDEGIVWYSKRSAGGTMCTSHALLSEAKTQAVSQRIDSAC